MTVGERAGQEACEEHAADQQRRPLPFLAAADAIEYVQLAAEAIQRAGLFGLRAAPSEGLDRARRPRR